MAPKWNIAHMYGFLPGAGVSSFMGMLEKHHHCIILDSGFSENDVYFYQVLTGEKVGWIRAEHLTEVK